MNKEIVELREVINKLVPLLAGKHIKVTQRGAEARVETDRVTGKPVCVNIPSISDNATSDFVRAIQGFIDNQVAKVLITDWSIYGKYSAIYKDQRRQDRLKGLHTIIEDTMVEREILKVFPGSKKNISQLRLHFIEKVTKPALKTAATEKERAPYLLVPVTRALAGQEEFIEFLDAEKLWEDDFVKKLMAELPKNMLEKLPKLTNTRQTLSVARAVENILYPNDSEPEEDEGDSEAQGKGKKPHTKSSSKAGGGKGGESEDTDGDSDADGKAGGKGKGNKSKSSKSAKSEDEDGEGSGKNEKEEDDKSSEKKDDKNDEGDGADDGDDPSSKDGSEGDDDDDQDGEDENSKGSQKDDGDDEDDADDEEEEEDEPYTVESENDNDHDGQVDHSTSDQESEGGGAAGGGAAKSMFDIDDDTFNKADLAKQVSIKLTNDAIDAMQLSDYTVYTRDDDKIEPMQVPPGMPSTWVPQMEEEVGNMVGKMQKDIERMIAAQSVSQRLPGHRSGRLHSPSLHRMMAADDRVFSRKHEFKSKATAVTLLVDNSGSMSGAKCKTAMLTAYALASTLERCKVPCEVLGFTTGGHYTYSSWGGNSNQHDAKVRFDRNVPIIMPVYKDFDERINSTVKSRISYMANKQIGMNANIDGESLEYAAIRLSKRREPRKVLMVLSDGQPAGANNAPSHLKTMVERLSKAGFELVGIGIQDSSVKHYYPKHFVINNVQELPSLVMTELRRILSA